MKGTPLVERRGKGVLGVGMFERALKIFSRGRSSAARIPMMALEECELIAMGPSDIHHLGSFAKSTIKKGEFIRFMRGDVIDFKDVLRRIKKGKITPDDPLQIDKDLFIDLDPPSLAINHSCNPNAGIRARNELIAICDIHAGEEVTFDYSTTVSCHVKPDGMDNAMPVQF